MVQATATAYTPTPRGTYRGKLTAIEEKKNDNGTFWIWKFTLIEDIEGETVEEEFERFVTTSSTNFGPKSKARGWVHNMIGRELDTKETIDFDTALVGKNYILTIGINNDKNTLDAITPAKRAPQRAQEAPQAPVRHIPGYPPPDGEDDSLDDVPFN